MEQEKLIRIAWKADKTIEVMSDFTKKVTIERLTMMGKVLEHNLGIGIEFIRYNKVKM